MAYELDEARDIRAARRTLRSRAAGVLAKMIAAGEMKRATRCSKCKGHSRIQAHHEAYAKPHEVVWLCHSCHVARHWEMTRAGVDAYAGTSGAADVESLRVARSPREGVIEWRQRARAS